MAAAADASSGGAVAAAAAAGAGGSLEAEETPVPLTDGHGKNLHSVVCSRCACVIIAKGQALLVTKPRELPDMYMRGQLADSASAPRSTVSQCWMLADMFAFENVGFCREVESTIKYLACADCEVGPIGWHDTTIPKEFFVSHERVTFRPKAK